MAGGNREMSEPETARAVSYGLRQRIGFVAGIALCVAVLLLPSAPGMTPEAKKAAAVALLMAAWWMSEAVHLAVTALVPLVLFPLLAVLDMPGTARNYAEPNVFLFMGGFMIAMAMQKWGLHKRLALHVIAAVGAGPRRLIGGFLLATAFISMWVSNTATAVMMLPIGMAVVAQVGRKETGGTDRFGLALMLGIAYAASIGGIATLVGTPPNIIFAGQSKALFPELGEVGFVRWFLFAFPVAAGLLALTWAYLAGVVARGAVRGAASDRDVIRRELARLGRWSAPEMAVMAVFAATALLWITRADLELGSVTLKGWSTLLGRTGVHDGTIAMAGALALFVIPAGGGRFLLDWEWARRLPWEVLLLFGGGFALAEGFQRSGLADWLGGGFAAMEGMSPVLVVFALALFVTFSSEVTSNTAQATMLMPVLAAASKALGLHPYLLMVPATLSASCAFMLPSGTPPNAIVFGSGKVTIPDMAKAGLFLNLAGAVWITAAVFLWGTRVFGMAAP
jgi:sodium-dependent dicarboxylate transporter 2/3/5